MFLVNFLTKTLLDLGEHRKIKKWIPHPTFGNRIFLPDPKELEEKWGMKDFGLFYNRLKYYTAEQILDF